MAGAWLGVYHNAEKDWDLYELAEKLVDLDHKFQLWRCHHLKTVERIIGYKPGTGGTQRRVLSRQGAGAQVLPGAVADPDLDVAACAAASPTPVAQQQRQYRGVDQRLAHVASSPASSSATTPSTAMR